MSEKNHNTSLISKVRKEQLTTSCRSWPLSLRSYPTNPSAYTADVTQTLLNMTRPDPAVLTS